MLRMAIGLARSRPGRNTEAVARGVSMKIGV